MYFRAIMNLMKKETEKLKNYEYNLNKTLTTAHMYKVNYLYVQSIL